MNYNKNNVGIVGYWFATNYGGVASYYSLYRKLEKLGYKPFFIENPYLKTDKEGPDVFSRVFFKTVNAEISEFLNIDDLSQLNLLSDIFVLGSDQVLTTSSIRAFGKLFLMDFAVSGKRRIAYSVSCGGDNLNADKGVVEYARNLLGKFSGVSVREYSAIDIVKNKFGMDTELVVDPILFTTAHEYEEIAATSGLPDESDYLLAYILDPSEDKRKCVSKISELFGLSPKVSLDGRKFTYEKNCGMMGLPEITLPQLDLPQWLHYFSNASYVFTDSFHGAVMAMIMNKPFIMYANYMRGFPRFETLAKLFDLSDRLIKKSDDLQYGVLDRAINYEQINEIIFYEQNRGTEWLKRELAAGSASIPNPFTSATVKSALDEKMCMGCSACVNICPKKALTLRPDEHGYYRSVINRGKCTLCGLCTKICPAIKLPATDNSSTPELYEFIAADEQVLWNSSSGGAFPLLAAEAFKRNGVVIGAAWRDDFTVEHIMIERQEDLHKLQKSKYLQTYMGDIYTQTKRKLEDGVFVLFSACPCQIAGLQAFLGKEYDNLVMIDLLCGNCPSSMFFKKYIEDDFPVGLEKYEFRHKVKGWNADCTTTTTNGVTTVRRGAKQDNYQRVYHNHTMCPPHCEKCKYQQVPRFGDITIGDFWGLAGKDPSVDVQKGVSAVLCNNQKGKDFFLRISSESAKVRKQVPLDWLGGNGYAIKGSHNYCSPNRDMFYDAIKTKSFSEAVTYALKPNHGVYETGLFNYRSSSVHFRFDSSVWEENYIHGVTVLTTRIAHPKPGCYCTLPINGSLKTGEKYKFKIRFKVSTESPTINFHIKDSGSQIFQVIYSHKVTKENVNTWVTVEKQFAPDCDYYDEFMVGAAQLNGKTRYIAIDYISITDAD